MKRFAIPRVCLMVLVLSANSLAKTPYHDFLLEDGRSFQGRIVAYDPHADLVSIERADKQLIKISPAVFDTADEVRIREWHLVQCFQSDKLFRIKAGRNAFKGKKVELPKWFGGGTTIKQMRHVRYIIDLENSSSLAFRNMTVEYRIHYSQEHRRTANNKWIKDEGVKCGSIFMTQLEPKSRREAMTADLIMNKTGDIPARHPEKSKEVDVAGIWIRITLPLSNDRKAVREYCLPDNLSKHKQWAPADVPVGLNEESLHSRIQSSPGKILTWKQVQELWTQ